MLLISLHFMVLLPITPYEFDLEPTVYDLSDLARLTNLRHHLRVQRVAQKRPQRSGFGELRGLQSKAKVSETHEPCHLRRREVAHFAVELLHAIALFRLRLCQALREFKDAARAIHISPISFGEAQRVAAVALDHIKASRGLLLEKFLWHKPWQPFRAALRIQKKLDLLDVHRFQRGAATTARTIPTI